MQCDTRATVETSLLVDGKDMWHLSIGKQGTVRVFRQKSTPENAICSHACSLEALAGV
jgi:hypothetical protein